MVRNHGFSLLGLALAVLAAASVAASAAPLLQRAAASAQPGKTYTYSSVRDGVAYGGTWKDDRRSILQSDASAGVDADLDVPRAVIGPATERR